MAQYEVVAVRRVPAQSVAPQLNLLGPLAASISWTDTLNEAPEATFVMDVNSLQADIKDALTDLVAKPLEVWVYRDGTKVFQGPIVGGEILDKSQLSLTCRGVEFYTAYMMVTADDQSSAVDQYTIVAGFIDDWQALDYGDYGIDTSGVGTSGTTRDYFVPGATEPRSVYEILQEFTSIDNGFDWYVNGTRDLVLGARGIDKTTSVFLERGVSSPAVRFTVAPDVVASEMYGTGTNSGADPLTSVKSNTTLRTTWGRAGASIAADGADTQALLDDATQYALDVRDGVYFSPGPALIPVSGSGVTDFEVGDIVTYTYDAGLGQQTGPYRVRKKTVNVDDNGQETINVEFV